LDGKRCAILAILRKHPYSGRYRRTVLRTAGSEVVLPDQNDSGSSFRYPNLRP